MNWDRVQGDWKQIKGKVREKWGNLTENDVRPSTASASSSKASYRNATATQKIK
jgi:uncharacterized protein YjbJ (UPF0337 family)